MQELNIQLSFEEDIIPLYREMAIHSLGWLAKHHLHSDNELKLTIGLSDSAQLKISKKFQTQLENRSLRHQQVLASATPIVLKDSRKPDYLSTIIYMMNYLQEYDVIQYDELERYRYEESYQNAFECGPQNLVVDYFKKLLAEIGLGEDNFVEKPSRLFVSHDVDTIHRGVFQDGFAAIKKLDIIGFTKVLASQLIGKPVWHNLERVMDVMERNGIRSTFFWLPESEKTEVNGKKLWNADYDIGSKYVKSVSAKMNGRGFGQGLHKSLASSSIKQEIDRLPIKTSFNRNHFLRIKIPTVFEDMDAAGIEQDHSLGFAEDFGFRNSYGYPYKPFNLNTKKPTKCLFVPLNIMDTSNWTYLGLSLKEMEQKIVNFISQNQSNAIISILWHNNYFSEIKYDGYTQVLENSLNHCRDRGIKHIMPQEINEEFK